MPLIDERNLVFGDTYVCITDKDKFFERILSAAKNANVEIAGRPVKYVSRDSHHGKMDVFTKFDKYSYQSEFRLVVYPGFGEVFKLQLGDLSDITIMGRLKNINDDIEIVELSHPPGDAK